MKFNGFMEDIPPMVDGELSLTCIARVPEDPVKGWSPYYNFAIIASGETVGNVNFRVGYYGDLEYKGQIGYDVWEAHRGKGYASRAVALIAPVARFHGMTKLYASNNVENEASRRVCEKLGLKLIKTVDVPESVEDLYNSGCRELNIYEWDLGE